MANLYRYMDTVGDGSGTDDFIGDYSSTAEEAIIKPAADEMYVINRMIVSVQDSAGMAASDYGNITGGLTNGISIAKDDGSNVLTDVTDGVTIKTNAEWGMLCYDVDLKAWANGPELLLVRFTFSKSGEPISLWGANGHRLIVNLNDNFDGLTSQRFMIQGTKKTITT